MLRALRAALALALLLVVPPVVLGAVTDPLHPPVTAQPEVLGVILRGSSLPAELVLYAAGLVAWGLWGYLATTTVLRLLLALPSARGRLWARARAVSDAVTLPFVCRLADGLVAAFLVVQTVRPFPAHAMPEPMISPAMVMEVACAQEPAQPHLQTQTADSIRYWVQPGDSLGLIADRIYGDWEQWLLLLETNRGVPQADGGTLTDAAVIRPGWVFRVPLPAERVKITPSGSIQYTVSRGDSLSGIAGRLLGNPNRWPELWHTNRDRIMGTGVRFDNPDVIQPGWQIEVPLVRPVSAGPTRRVPDQESSVVATPTPSTSADPSESSGRSSPPETDRSTPVPPSAGAAETTPAAETGIPPATEVRPPAATEPAATETDAGEQRGIPAVGMGAAGAALVAAGALAAWRWRVNRRRRLHDDPELADLPYDFGGAVRRLTDGFLAADILRLVRQRAHGVETDKVRVLAARLRAALAELGFQDIAFLTAMESRRELAFSIAAPAELQGGLLAAESWEHLEERLGCTVHVARTSDGDLRVELAHLRATDMVALGAVGSRDLWLPIGVAQDGRHLHLNLSGIGHLLVAGREAPALLATLVLSAAAALPPEVLELVLVRSGEILPSELEDLPHAHGSLDGMTNSHLSERLAELERELVRRLSADGTGRESIRPVVIVIDELAAVADQRGLAGLLAEGGAVGMHVLAATMTDGTSLPGALLADVPGRVVLRTPDPESSARLLGRSGAEELEGGGDLYARVAGHEPMRVRGFRIETDELRACVAVMRGPEASSVAPAPTTATRDEPMPAADPGATGDSTATESASRNGVAHESDVRGVTSEEARPRSDPPGAAEDIPEPVTTAAPMPHAEHDQACRAPLELHCFGPFLVLRDGHQVTAWERPAARELLAYLVLHGRRGVSPDQLKEALWPDKSPEAGDRLLWPRLSQARKAIGDDKERPFIHFSAGLYRLDADRVWSDVWAFDDAVARARRLAGAEQEAELARAAELYTGELFADHCPDWAVELQEEYRARALDALNRIAAIAFRRGDPGAAARSYRRALALDPINEEVATNLARMLHQLGDRPGLIRLRASLTDALRRELDDPEAEPQPETAAVFGAALADLETRSSGSASTPRRA